MRGRGLAAVVLILALLSACTDESSSTEPARPFCDAMQSLHEEDKPDVGDTPEDSYERWQKAAAQVIEAAPDDLRAEVYVVLATDPDPDEPLGWALSRPDALKAMNDYIRSNCAPSLVWDRHNEA